MRLPARFAALLWLLVATATGASAADGRILDFDGDVRVNGNPVTAATLLHRQDVITAGAGASARIILADNSVLDLDSGTEIRLSDYSFDPAEPAAGRSDIDVVEGSLRYVSGLIAKDNPDNISFSAGGATIGVRGSYTGIDVDGVVVDVQSMIGEAVLIRDGVGGEKDTIVIPTGKTTQTDPATGETVVGDSTVPNAVNDVVRAIAAASPDALSGSTAEGCSRGNNPIRPTANPAHDPELQAEIRKLLAALSEGELMMVIAVLNNNARHLCIDTFAVNSAISEIATVRPEAAAQVVFVAALIDPANAAQYTATAQAAAPGKSDSIQQATDDAKASREEFGTDSPSSTPTEGGEAPPEPGDPADNETDVPPGGEPPSPE